jgi:hypothetical protein
MAQGSFGEVKVWDDFLGPDNDLTWGTGTVKVGNVGFVSVNEGSFEWTVDEPGGILAITTDTGDDDNAALMAGTFSPADGGMEMEVRFKTNSATLGAIFAGFTETLALDTPVMPAEVATTTVTHNGTGGMAGLQLDTDATTIDFRAVFGDGGAALARKNAAGSVVTAINSVAGATITADRWYVARVEVKPDGTARVLIGEADAAKEMKVVAESTAALGTTDKFYAVLMFENRSAAARLFEVDYFYARGFRDWRPD